MKLNSFFINFQWLSFAKNCLTPETADLTILAIKSGILSNFTKTLISRNFQLLLICESSKLSSYSLLKSMSKIPILDLNKRTFFEILPYVQRAAILVPHGLTS